jgi:hypothetical protein
MNTKRLARKLIANRELASFTDDLIGLVEWDYLMLCLSNACVYRAGYAETRGKRGTAAMWRKRARWFHRLFESLRMRQKAERQLVEA